MLVSLFGKDLLGSSRKCPCSPLGRDWNFLGSGGSARPKNLERCMKLNWNFQRGGEVLKKIPSMGEVWIFSGTTHQEGGGGVQYYY